MPCLSPRLLVWVVTFPPPHPWWCVTSPSGIFRMCFCAGQTQLNSPAFYEPWAARPRRHTLKVFGPTALTLLIS